MASQDTNRHSKTSDTAAMAVHTVESACPETPAPEAVVFDLDGLHVNTVNGLSWLLTAQRVASDASRLVWLRNAPARTWALFRALGVDELFVPFPEVTPESN